MKSLTTRRFKNLEIDGHKFRIQSITAREWRQIAKKVRSNKSDVDDEDARLIVACVIDETGNPVYKDSDIVEISNWDVKVLLPLYVTCEQHCGLDRSVKDAVKNLDETPTPSST